MYKIVHLTAIYKNFFESGEGDVVLLTNQIFVLFVALAPDDAIA